MVMEVTSKKTCNPNVVTGGFLLPLQLAVIFKDGLIYFRSCSGGPKSNTLLGHL